MAEAAATPTRGEHDASLHERALKTAVANLAVAPFWLVPFTVLFSLLTKDQNDSLRLQLWVTVSVVATVIVAGALGAYRRLESPATPTWVVNLLRVALCSIGVLFGMSAWVAGRATVELTMLFAIFPMTVAAVASTLTAGRRDMFASVTIPISLLSIVTLSVDSDYRLRWLSVLWIFYTATLTWFFGNFSKTVRTAIVMQKTSEELLDEIASDQTQLSAANSELARTIEQLTYQATHDTLTGLLNRRGVLEVVETMIVEATPLRPVGILFLDLDRFKAVNDALGHRGGDHYLRIVADRIGRCVKPTGVAGRLGGDEFIVALPGADELTTVDVANQLQNVLSQGIHAEGRELPSSVSIGIAHAPAHGGNVSDVLANANIALYRAKSDGRNRTTHFDVTLAHENRSRIELELRLRRAIDDGDIVPFFQPEIDATTGMIVGAELLARWVQPNGSVTAAHDFMDLAVSAGLLDRVTERVLSGARRQIRRLAVLGLPSGFRFRVNLAPHSTERPWRNNPIDALVHGIDPALLTVDIRESFVNADLDSAAANLSEFRQRGGRVCLDDFAQGVSSLSMLRLLPLDEVRIDRISIDTITSHPHDRAIVRSIIALTREIGLEVTADGVETGAQADALIALGCVRQQGHLYAPALPEASFENYLLRRLAEQYVQTADAPPTWNTTELG